MPTLCEAIRTFTSGSKNFLFLVWDVHVNFSTFWIRLSENLVCRDVHVLEKQNVTLNRILY
jgi:hypothetical protein